MILERDTLVLFLCDPYLSRPGFLSQTPCMSFQSEGRVDRSIQYTSRCLYGVVVAAYPNPSARYDLYTEHPCYLMFSSETSDYLRESGVHDGRVYFEGFSLTIYASTYRSWTSAASG